MGELLFSILPDLHEMQVVWRGEMILTPEEAKTLRLIRDDSPGIWIDMSFKYWFADENGNFHGPYNWFKDAENALTDYAANLLIKAVDEMKALVRRLEHGPN